jgi:pimeloyl-ACP methyl ester carboxylesterase
MAGFWGRISGFFNGMFGRAQPGFPPADRTQPAPLVQERSFDFRTIHIDEKNGLDIIFVHGLISDSIAAWTSPNSGEPEGDFWPKWIAADVPGANIYTLGYPASLFAKWLTPEMDLFERAKATLECFASHDIGKRPLALVTHSLGGLLAKQLLRTGADAPDRAWRAVPENCRLVVFFSTPHTGASVASVLSLIARDLISPAITALQEDAGPLFELNEDYRRRVRELNIQTLVYYEKYPTNGVLIVDRRSADPGVPPPPEPIPVDANHMFVCKPPRRDSELYRSIRRRLRDLAATNAAERAESPHAEGVRQMVEAEHARATALVHEAVQAQMVAQAPAGYQAAAQDRLRRGAIDTGIRPGLVGKWAGSERQATGPAGQPIEYDVELTLEVTDGKLSGVFRFIWKKDSEAIVDEALPFSGGILHDRYLVLDYRDDVSGKIQFGTLLLELSEDAAVLTGRDIGFGYSTKKIVTAEVELRRQPAGGSAH